MTPQELKDSIAEMDEDVLFADGLDGALIGTVTIFNKTVALYDRSACIRIFMDRDGMSEEGANEFFEFNVIGAYVGEYTPAFADIHRKAGIGEGDT